MYEVILTFLDNHPGITTLIGVVLAAVLAFFGFLVKRLFFSKDEKSINIRGGVHSERDSNINQH